MDDEQFEEDEQFYIKLGNLRVENICGDAEPIPELNLINLSLQSDLLKRTTQQSNGLQAPTLILTAIVAQEPCKLLKTCIQLKQSAATATIRILDDDHSGIFQFEKGNEEVPETIGDAVFVVLRMSGMIFASVFPVFLRV